MIAFDIEKADHLTNQINRAEMMKKYMLFAIIGMLGLIDILILLLKIIRWACLYLFVVYIVLISHLTIIYY